MVRILGESLHFLLAVWDGPSSLYDVHACLVQPHLKFLFVCLWVPQRTVVLNGFNESQLVGQGPNSTLSLFHDADAHLRLWELGAAASGQPSTDMISLSLSPSIQ